MLGLVGVVNFNSEIDREGLVMCGHLFLRVVAFAVAGMVFVLPAFSAQAGFENDKQTCLKHSEPKPTILACTRAIRSGRLDRKSLTAAYARRGWSFLLLKSHKRAFKDFDKLVALDPRMVFLRGMAYSQIGDHQRAIADLNKAVTFKPVPANTYNARGLAYLKSGQYRRAIADFDRSLSLTSPPMVAYVARLNRGRVYLAIKDYGRAFTDFDMAIKINPRIDVAYIARGRANNLVRRYKRAIRDFDKAIAINPRAARAYSFRGAAYVGRRKYREAIADLDKGIAMNCEPNCLAANYALRGFAYEHLGKPAAAKRDYRAALRIDPANMVARLGLRRLGVAP